MDAAVMGHHHLGLLQHIAVSSAHLFQYTAHQVCYNMPWLPRIVHTHTHSSGAVAVATCHRTVLLDCSSTQPGT